MTEASPPRGPRLRYADVNYRPRIVGGVLFVVIMMSIATDDLLGLRIAFCLIGLSWAHIAYWLARKGGKWTEKSNILIDCFMGGLVVSAMSFRLWPATAIYAILIINALFYGGPRFMLIGLGVSAIGLTAIPLVFHNPVHLETEPLTVALSVVTIFAYIALFGTTGYRLRMRQREIRDALEREEGRSRDLLLNVFPRAVVPRLKAAESPIADQFADVTVVFVDVVEFTPLSERLGPKRTVLLLNELFGRFDQAAARLGVEKIETTGDGYLAIGGAPEPLDNHPDAVADFALAAVEAARMTGASDMEHVQIRVGIHTGPVFAGVIGESRFHYKIFGETVNTASRIQAQSRPGRILVSETTFKRIRLSHILQEHGTLELKGHGPVRTFWLLDGSATAFAGTRLPNGKMHPADRA
jgi:class 3 adenylate cyclase